MLLYSLVLHYITKINKYSLQITSLDILLHDFPLNIFMYIKYSCEYGVIMIYLFGKIDMFEDVEVLYVKYLSTMRVPMWYVFRKFFIFLLKKTFFCYI